MKSLEHIKSISIIISLVIFWGCNSILEPEPKGQIQIDQLATTNDGFISLLNGAYQPLATGGIYNQGLYQVLEKASDDGYTWRKESDPQLYNLQPTSSVISSIWSAHYTGIERCNVILSRISDAQNLSDALKNKIIGQVKFLRALYYFNLVRFYGRVPLITKEVKSRSDAEIARGSMKDVYNLIKSDLSDAINLLPESYNGDNDFYMGMATQGAAKALKAKVHLELEEWQDAASLAEGVINSGDYTLYNDYSSNFYGNSENGSESVFEVQFTDASGGIHNGISNFLAPQEFQGPAAILPTDNNNDFGVASTGDGIVQAFESGDLRKDIAIDNYGLANFLAPSKPDGSLYYINKFFTHGDFQPGFSPFNFTVIRYSEVLLVAAEALNELVAGNSNAIKYVNAVRERAGLQDLDSSTTSDQNKFRQAIRHERRVELSFEAKRYFDLNRWGILKETLADQKVDVPSSHTIKHPITGQTYFLYPIPSTEFVNNAKLGDQNPGY